MIYTIGDRRLVTATDDWFVAPDAQLIGSVHLGHEVSVWFGVVLRADSDEIRIGEGTNVQDGTIMHTDAGRPLVIGQRCTIGHKAFLHGCTVGDDTMIANGAMVLDRTRIGSHCLIAAGALVPPDKEIPDGSVVMGSPGRIVRTATDKDLALIERAGRVYRDRQRQYREQLRVDARSRDVRAGGVENVASEIRR